MSKQTVLCGSVVEMMTRQRSLRWVPFSGRAFVYVESHAFEQERGAGGDAPVSGLSVIDRGGLVALFGS